jgi:hypothetical protein
MSAFFWRRGTQGHELEGVPEHEENTHKYINLPLCKQLSFDINLSLGNVVCNCNFVICTVKYTHICALGTAFKHISKGNVGTYKIGELLQHKTLGFFCLGRDPSKYT